MTELKLINEKLDTHLAKINMEEIENKKKDIIINIEKMRNKSARSAKLRALKKIITKQR